MVTNTRGRPPYFRSLSSCHPTGFERRSSPCLWPTPPHSPPARACIRATDAISPKGGPSDQLAAAIFGELAAPADYVIDLHSGGVEYVFLPVAGFYGEPSSGNPSFQAARTFGLPALWQLPETDGVLSCEAWRRGKIAIGTEYLGAGQLSADGVRDYRNGVAACLAHWGMLTSAPQAPKTPD